MRKIPKSMKARAAVWSGLLIAGAVSSLVMDWFWFRSWLLNPVWHLATFAAGLGLLQLMRRGARNTGRYLARHGHEGPGRPFEPNKLVDGDYYACMRHPMHLALLLAPPSIALILGSVSFLLIVAPAEMLLIVALILIVEEPQARRKFGDAYREYAQTVPFFSFRWSCLRKLFAR